MTASPPSHQLWHPSRGICFSPSPQRTPLESPRSFSNAAATESEEQATALESKQGEGLLGQHIGEPVTDPTLPTSDAVLAAPDNEVAAGGNIAVEVIEPENAIAESPATSNDIPYPALDWKVSEELFRAAKNAAPETPESYWSYRLYRGPNAEGPDEKVKVHYCRSKHTAERVCQEYFVNEKVLGFDLEWVADATKWQGVKRNVSLIQIASPSRIALFHVALFPKSDDYVAPSFKKIMEDSKITKVGVWIKGDATKLRTYMGIESKGLMELSHMYRLVTYSKTGQFKAINKKLIPLATQVQDYLHLPMFKGQNVRSSDWSQPLGMDQIKYSASDAYAGVQLYAALERERKQLDPCPPRPHHLERELPIRLTDGMDLETESEKDLDEPVDECLSPGFILSPAQRRRQLRVHLRSVRDHP
ncbi:ribonuclease H-like domain-containing protein [Pseudomassariella vexata]|uniref:Ribonuclease H-like domain-containing protein n=1 Tax=Pseudomassariella vexata TaxID=1141098 RepID=A0A1Y2EHY8_9PEZI|nr:ribonuclease H-like domain-containing protein [Pseudomassariella vexata]ORY71189.1 ribonuclease H-like domain-containing protein [Pseudomassariella vexata]